MSGKLPYQCRRARVASQSMCEDYCTSLSSCVAYVYTKMLFASNKCYLHPSVRSCPSGFSPFLKSGPIAATMTDLRGDDRIVPNTVCYGKN